VVPAEQFPKLTFGHLAEQIPVLLRFDAGIEEGGTVVIGRHYFVRQATTLLKFANTNPQLALPS
jgi:hypothetical protein